MKTILIGDIHGRSDWKQIIEKETPDRVIFIGDYFDSFVIKGIDQLHNFKEIVNYKDTADCEVILLIGNHDHHYCEVGETYSGFNPSIQYEAYQLLNDNKHKLQIAYQFDNVLCSHAGLSEKWLDDVFYRELKSEWDLSNVVEKVNELYEFKPRMFNFRGHDPYGGSVDSGPLWIRPNALLRSNKKSDLKKNFIQIVGHTEQTDLNIKLQDKWLGGKYYIIDNLYAGEYFIYEDGNFRVGNLWSRDFK